jgi:hypothetical protein
LSAFFHLHLSTGERAPAGPAEIVDKITAAIAVAY